MKNLNTLLAGVFLAVAMPFGALVISSQAQLGSLGRAEPDRLWGIGLVATGIAALAYFAFAALAGAINRGSQAVTVPSAVLSAGDKPRPAWQQARSCRRKRFSGTRVSVK